jgi:hypothetical protein
VLTPSDSESRTVENRMLKTMTKEEEEKDK